MFQYLRNSPRHKSSAPHIGLATAAILVFVVALAAFAYAGSHARYMADDFCTAYELDRNGFLLSQKHWYMGWTGRYSFTAAVNLAELIGPTIVPFLPSFALGLWLSIWVWTSVSTQSVGSPLTASTGFDSCVGSNALCILRQPSQHWPSAVLANRYADVCRPFDLSDLDGGHLLLA